MVTGSCGGKDAPGGKGRRRIENGWCIDSKERRLNEGG